MKVTLSLMIMRKTADAVLVSDGDTECWIPKASVEYDDSVRTARVTDFTMTEKLAIEKGLV